MRSPTNMADRFYPNQFTHPPQPRREPAQRAAYLLGMGPMPPPRPQEVAVAAAVHLLDHGSGNDSDEENIDPQLRRQEQTQAYEDKGISLLGGVHDDTDLIQILRSLFAFLSTTP